MTVKTADIKLNIGAGKTVIEGFTPIDRSLGFGKQEAWPLSYRDECVSEIRASHILEHFSEADVPNVLADWVRVLKPGGRIRLAVPDFDKIAKDLSADPKRFAYLMGGQTDDNDFHKSAFTADKLTSQMLHAGITDIKPWKSDNTDCASLRVSLNLEGIKNKTGNARAVTNTTGLVKIKAYMTLPRYGSLNARGICENSLKQLQIPLETSQGVFWGQHMQRHLQNAVDKGIDWALTVDFDSVFTPEHLDQLIGTFGSNGHIDALAALECRREGDRPLMTVGGASEVASDGQPILSTTAHFGLTLIRIECLADVKKPWFFGEPDKDGNWSDTGRLDPDIWFWHQWRKAGKKLYVDPKVRIGHLEECVSYYDEKMDVQRCGVPAWRKMMFGVES